jgi:hypothetical protein
MEAAAGNPQTEVTPESPHAARLLAWADRHRWWLFGAAALLYVAGFNGQWRVSPDSALYASLGRSLAEGLGYTYQGEHHKWVEAMKRIARNVTTAGWSRQLDPDGSMDRCNSTRSVWAATPGGLLKKWSSTCRAWNGSR